MYNDHNNQKPVNVRENLTNITPKKDKLNCSCPNSGKFEQIQSDNTLNLNKLGRWKRATDESRKFLREELKKYGLHPKSLPTAETVHYNSPNYTSVKDDTNVKIETNSKNEEKTKSKTEPNLLSKYVDNLKKEIKSNMHNIPELPEKCKSQYLNSLKKELLLNKICTTGCEKNPIVNRLQKEINDYRKNKFSPYLQSAVEPFLQSHKTKNKKKRSKGKRSGYSSRTSSDRGSLRDKKKTKKKITKKCEQCCGKEERQDDGTGGLPSKLPIEEHRASSSKKESKSISDFPKNSTTISTQCQVEVTQKISLDENTLKKIDEVQNLLPAISDIIQNSERKLHEALEKTLKTPRILLERGISPVKEFLEPILKCEGNDKFEDYKKISVSSQKTTPVQDLIMNIENIKESRCLLESFRKELSKIRDDIRGCTTCNVLIDRDWTEETYKKFCKKHSIYVPLLKLGDIGSKSDQIRLFDSFKTEINMKKEIEKQLNIISELEEKLSSLKKNNEMNCVKPIEKALEFYKSYLNNLLIKQETERLLNEQQEMMNRTECGQGKPTEEDCQKCCMGLQIHDLLEKVRENITEDLSSTRQRLKVQKMPSIDIKKPLQLQNTLNLNIPPTFKLLDQMKNVRIETVKEKYEAIDQTIQTIPRKKEDMKKKKEKKEKISRKLSKPSEEERLAQKSMGSPTVRYSIPTSEDIPDQMEISPSQLGISRTIGTQCDSEIHLRMPKYTENVEIQASLSYVESVLSFLFGFKEYMLKRSNEFSSKPSGDDKVDVKLQVDMEDSSDSLSEIFKRDSRKIHEESKQKSSKPDDDDLKLDHRIRKEIARLKKTMAFEKDPSIKKMVLRDSNSELESSRMNEYLKNPDLEPRYRIKNFSFSRTDSISDSSDASSNTEIYKSLTNHEEIPDRINSSSINVGEIVKRVSSKSPDPSEFSLIRDKEPEVLVQEGDPIGIVIPKDVVESLQLDYSSAEEPADKIPSVTKVGFVNIDDEKTQENLEVTEEIKHIEDESPQEVEVVREGAHTDDAKKIGFVNISQDDIEEDIDPTDSYEIVLTDPTLNELKPISFQPIEVTESINVKDDFLDLDSLQFLQKDSKIEIATTEDMKDSVTNLKRTVGNEPKRDLISFDEKEDVIPSEYSSILKSESKFSSDDEKKNVSVIKKYFEDSDEKLPASERDKTVLTVFPQTYNFKITSKKNNMGKIVGQDFPLNTLMRLKRTDKKFGAYIDLEESSDDFSTKNTCLLELKKQRVQYSNKCETILLDSSKSPCASSEGELSCRCTDVSMGEIHECSRKRNRHITKQFHPGITNKDKLSSHLILDRERKHYNHWVTYYSIKEKKENSSTSSLDAVKETELQ